MKKTAKTTMETTMEMENINVTINDSKAARAEMIINTTSELWGKRIAIIPIDLLDVDYSYQRVRTAHVNKIYDNWDEKRCDFLIVSYRNGVFYIIDGQHRYYAALARGVKNLPCIIKTGMTMEDEAYEFVKWNTSRKPLSPFDTYKANIACGNEKIPEVKVDMTIKKVCDKYGITIKKAPNSSEPKILRTVTDARAIVCKDCSGEERLDWILDLISKSNWVDCPETYGSDFLRMFSNYYTNNVNDLENAKARAIKGMCEVSPSEFATKALYRYSTYKRVAALALMFCNNI